MRAADYIFKHLADRGVRDVFLVTGGGAMHLNNALALERRIRPICCHHEQACAIAAEGYTRVVGGIGVVSVTSGPGGTNALTGVIGQWLDSIPVLYVSGQVKFQTCIASCPELGLRQLGDQEINIVDIVRPVTKYAVLVSDPTRIRYELEKAISIALSGRPGPVWLDIPLDVQAAPVDANALVGFTVPVAAEAPTSEQIERVRSILVTSNSPVLVAGHGIRIAGAQRLFEGLVRRLEIPVLTTFNGLDLLTTDHPCYVGRIGNQGTRAGNFAIQNADVALFIGTRNNIRQVSYGWENFAASAVKIVVDVDDKELEKPTIRPDIAIQADAGAFLAAMSESFAGSTWRAPSEWRSWCIQRRERYPVALPEYALGESHVHPYHFVDRLTALAKDGEVFVTGNGTASVAYSQAARVKMGQRGIMNSGCAAMGYGLPAAMGAAFASEGGTVCLDGDGSIMMNLQELQTIAHHRVPLKIFVFNNDGYSSIVQTQTNFFDGVLIGCNPASGVTFPSFQRVAEAFALPYARIDSHAGLDTAIQHVLDAEGPLLCEVVLRTDYTFAPKISSRRLPDGRMVSSPPDDMAPFLSREEYASNRYVGGLG